MRLTACGSVEPNASWNSAGPAAWVRDCAVSAWTEVLLAGKLAASRAQMGCFVSVGLLRRMCASLTWEALVGGQRFCVHQPAEFVSAFAEAAVGDNGWPCCSRTELITTLQPSSPAIGVGGMR